MNWFAFHIASGDSLYSGAALIACGLLSASCWSVRVVTALGKTLALLGACLVLLSSASALVWGGIPLVLTVLGWVWLEGRPSVARKRLAYCKLALVVICIGMLLLELPQRWPGRLPQVKHDKIYIVGDSISAGIDVNKPNWPGLLQSQIQAKIVNLAKPAATLDTGLKQASQIPDEACLVLIELGGNDLLSRGSARALGADLEKLLATLDRPGRTLAMFELPLLPGQFLVGRSQRAAAKAHHCYLIPKRFFAGVLASPEATVDGLHLSDHGNQAMAALVKDKLAPVLRE